MAYQYTTLPQTTDNVVPPGLFKYSSGGLIDADVLFRERLRQMPNVPIIRNDGAPRYYAR